MRERGGNRECLHDVLHGGIKQNGKDADRAEGAGKEIELKDALAVARGILDRYERGMLLAEAARITEENRRKAQEKE